MRFFSGERGHPARTSRLPAGAGAPTFLDSASRLPAGASKGVRQDAGRGDQDGRAPQFPNLCLAAALLALVALTGCDNMPGRPKLEEQTLPPDAVVDFQKLYRLNCNGCHGFDGNIAGSIAMDDQTYLAIVPKAKMREVIANGIPGTLMPAFSQAQGGTLTEKQIDILVDGIFAWKQAGATATDLPPYSAPPGDAVAGEATYAAYLASLQASAPATMFADGFLTNPAFLGLTSDQHLRTLVIVGRPELGIPNFRTALNGGPLSNDQISDIVAWLISQRKNEFGQPLIQTPAPDVTQ